MNIKKYLLLILALLTVLTAAGCKKDTAESPDSTAAGIAETTPAEEETEAKAPGSYVRISAEEAKKIIDGETGYIILDVRTQEEYDSGHIPGALLLPNEAIGTEEPGMLPDKNQKILVYCRSGNRSRQASQKLADLGYTNIYEFGGIIDWPYETVK